MQLGPIVNSRGLSLQTLAISPTCLGEPMGRSFEATQQHLDRIPRMLFEPDGSFVWTGSHDDDQAWQVDGVVYDRNGFVRCVEIKGLCPEQTFDLLLSAIGWPGTDLIFQLADEAVFIDEGEFRRFAISAS